MTGYNLSLYFKYKDSQKSLIKKNIGKDIVMNFQRRFYGFYAKRLE